jgi:hypothetical protein
MTWQCGRLVAAMEDHMSKTLTEPVAIDVGINESYDQGVEEVTQGQVDFARFPNVDHGWVIHPDVPERVVLAWREAFVSMNLEYLPYMVNPNVFIEGDIGHCRELERLAENGRILGAVNFEPANFTDLPSCRCRDPRVAGSGAAFA